MTPVNTYTSGQLSKRSNVSIRTIRYYDKIGLLKPTYVNDAGYRLYTDADFIILQKIIVLKNLGFSLDEIAIMTREEINIDNLKESFQLQLSLIHQRIEELKRIEASLEASSTLLDSMKEPNWNELIPFFHLMNMKDNIKEQYKNANNLNVRIRLHERYSHNKQGWYPWIYSIVSPKEGDNILEIGCGNGQFWVSNLSNLPNDCNIILSDVSKGMITKASKNIKNNLLSFSENEAKRISSFFSYECFDCNKLPYPDQSFDVIYANHVLFYIKDFSIALKEIQRLLKPNGFFCCTTYGKSHMQEINQLVKEFDPHIALSEINLYDLFGLEHGQEQLKPFFEEILEYRYDDYLNVTNAKDLLEYIYSCHGNQMDYINRHIDEFEHFITKKIGKKGIKITKDAGLFLCRRIE